MIITERKPFQEVLGNLEGFSRVAILGCGRCASTCQTGGERQVEEMKEDLESKGFKVVYTDVIEAQCDERLTKKTLQHMPDVDVFVSMACGSGASALGDLTEKPVIPSNNTLFLGVVKRLGVYDERCSMCGDCTLFETSGICVKTRCSKSLLNGPCGGSMDGICEAEEGRDCAWALIIDRLRRAEKIKDLKQRKTPRKIHEKSRPRRVG
jgi:ferredoxin